MHQAFSDNDVGRKYTTVGPSTHCTIRTYLCLTQKCKQNLRNKLRTFHKKTQLLLSWLLQLRFNHLQPKKTIITGTQSVFFLLLIPDYFPPRHWNKRASVLVSINLIEICNISKVIESKGSLEILLLLLLLLQGGRALRRRVWRRHSSEMTLNVMMIRCDVLQWRQRRHLLQRSLLHLKMIKETAVRIVRSNCWNANWYVYFQLIYFKIQIRSMLSGQLKFLLGKFSRT